MGARVKELVSMDRRGGGVEVNDSLVTALLVGAGVFLLMCGWLLHESAWDEGYQAGRRMGKQLCPCESSSWTTFPGHGDAPPPVR